MWIVIEGHSSSTSIWVYQKSLQGAPSSVWRMQQLTGKGSETVSPLNRLKGTMEIINLYTRLFIDSKLNVQKENALSKVTMKFSCIWK